MRYVTQDDFVPGTVLYSTVSGYRVELEECTRGVYKLWKARVLGCDTVTEDYRASYTEDYMLSRFRVPDGFVTGLSQ